MLKRLLNGEITDWPEIQQLSQLFQQNQFSEMGFDLPGLLAAGGENALQTEKNALAWQKGDIPPEAQDALRRFGAQQNLTSGMGFWNPAAGGANQIRNFFAGPGGLLDYQKAGIDAAAAGGNATQRWQQIAKGTMLPENAYLYSPQWYTDFMAKQYAAQRDAKLQKAIENAQPDPAWADRGRLAGSILGAYAGGGFGAGNSMNSAQTGASAIKSVPSSDSISGQWAKLTGQPYEIGGSDSGANATIQYNATPFQTNPDGSLYYPPPPNSFNSVPPPSSVNPAGGSYNPISYQPGYDPNQRYLNIPGGNI
jgi:hypothetical protein